MSLGGPSDPVPCFDSCVLGAISSFLGVSVSGDAFVIVTLSKGTRIGVWGRVGRAWEGARGLRGTHGVVTAVLTLPFLSHLSPPHQGFSAMGSGPIDPKELLKGLDCFLGRDGEVKSTEGITKIFK